MKLSCLQEDLCKGLKIVGRATGSKLPVTKKVLLSTKDGYLELVATDLEMFITHEVRAKVTQEGSIAVPANLLIDFVSSLSKGPIKVSVPVNSHVLELEGGNTRANIRGVAVEDFVSIPLVNNGKQVMTTTIQATALREGVMQTVFAAATEQNRPILTGICAEFGGMELELVAVDGFRLAVHRASLETLVDEKTMIIVPAKFLDEVGRLLKEQEGAVEIFVDEKKNMVLFRFGGTDLISNLIQGSFPQYVNIIPKAYTTRAIIDTKELLRSVKLSSVFSREESYISRFVISPGTKTSRGKITVTGQSIEVGGSVSEVDASVEGEEAKIAFNFKFILDVLSVIPQSQVALEVTTPSSPEVIRPVGVDNYQYIFMPMFVQW